jgi:FAD/FMN-containing dehydrogenase
MHFVTSQLLLSSRLAISARCTYVGVGGSIITGGISWLSSEYGLASDPQNMLDAQVVKPNGQVVWASAEPDLLWALRGGGGGFGGKSRAIHGFDQLIAFVQLSLP